MSAAAQATLALMLLLQQPGRSAYSIVPVAECDDVCQQQPVCAEPLMSCAPPRWSPRREGFIRLETYDEGLRRYASIARVASQVAEDAEAWRGEAADLRRLLVTVAFHESGFRRDIHEGSRRGDCDYRLIGGVRERIPGSCRSHCLGQIFLRKGRRTVRGYTGDDLVGLDDAATRRCLETVADRLGEANRACTVQHNAKGVHPACTMGMYGGVATFTADPRIQVRVRTYEQLRFSKPALSDEVRERLADPDPPASR